MKKLITLAVAVLIASLCAQAENIIAESRKSLPLTGVAAPSSLVEAERCEKYGGCFDDT